MVFLDPLVLPGQSIEHVGGDLFGGDRSLPSAPEVLEQPGALADQTGRRSLPGGDEKQSRDRHADVDERVGILGVIRKSSGIVSFSWLYGTGLGLG